MKSTAAKFLLPLAALGLLFAGFLHYRAYTAARQHLTQILDREAAIAMEFNLAVREYVGEEIRPVVAALIGHDDFIPEAMSTSYVSRNVFEQVRKKFPDLIIKFSSDNPRNPINQASADELRIIEYFNAHPEDSSLTRVISVAGKQYQAHFTAKRMVPSCLRCHGEPEDAPAALLARYGDQASFHRPLGQVVAMDTVAIPLDPVTAALATETRTQTGITVAGLVLLLLSIWLVFRVQISGRLEVMAAHFRSIAGQPDASAILPVEIRGGDEIANLAASFNTLASRLQGTYASLEERVSDRTAELARANVELRCEIADRQRAEQQLQQAKTAAEAAAQAKSEFLANMSHEVRTPMTAILGYADVLLEPEHVQDAPPERVEAARTIKRNGEHLLNVLDDILDLSKIEAGRMTVERMACDPFQVAGDVAALMSVRAKAKRLPFHVDHVGAIPARIHTDPTRVRQILINLIGNAIKFTERGEIRLVVRLVDSGTNPRLQFDVVDTGIGMTAAQVTGLFRPFTQADTSTSRSFGGTGLGLTISKHLAEMLGGDVVLVETQVGVGTRFRATVSVGNLAGVPMVDNAASATNVPGPPPDSSVEIGQPVLHGCRIMLVEDGPDNQRLISHFLQRAGAAVTVAESGEAALRAIFAARTAELRFHVVLMDMQMPVMDGYTATRLLRGEGYTGPIIALTAHAMTSDRERCLACGCDEYVSKPVNRASLIETVGTFLQAQTDGQPLPRHSTNWSCFTTASGRKL